MVRRRKSSKMSRPTKDYLEGYHHALMKMGVRSTRKRRRRSTSTRRSTSKRRSKSRSRKMPQSVKDYFAWRKRNGY